jgi:hypothetical protein
MGLARSKYVKEGEKGSIIVTAVAYAGRFFSASMPLQTGTILIAKNG